MRREVAFALVLLLGSGSCAKPPPDAYVGASGARGGVPVPLGQSRAGESCDWFASGNGGEIFCGAWEHPSGRVEATVIARTAPLDSVVGPGSPWRAALDGRFQCESPVATTILGGIPAQTLSCTRRVGGWPQAALVAVIDGRAYKADGILTIQPLLERAIGVASGRVAARDAASLPPSKTDALYAVRLAKVAFTTGDLDRYAKLMESGNQANLSQNFAVAEEAFRAALFVQQKTLGDKDPATAMTLAHVALQVSDQGRFAEADALFAQTDSLASRSSDATTRALILHYRGLHAMNRQDWPEALTLLDRAEAIYVVQLEPGDLAMPAATSETSVATGLAGAIDVQTVMSPARESALIGVIEVRRNRAKVLAELDRIPESTQASDAAAALAQAHRLLQPSLSARVFRTSAVIAASQGQENIAGTKLARSADAFDIAQHGQLPFAETALLQAEQSFKRGDTETALRHCRAAAKLLRELKSGVRPELLSTCLRVLDAAAARAGSEEPLLREEMFTFAQLGRSSVTARQIALAAARLQENARDPRVGEAIRRWQDATLEVADLRGLQAEAGSRAGGPETDSGATSAPSAAALNSELEKAQANLNDAAATLQEASPRYGQLVQETVAAADVLKALRPREALASIFLGPDAGWTFILRNDHVEVQPVPLGAAAIASLVTRLRASVEAATETPPPFDVDAARKLYDALFGTSGAHLRDLDAIVVAPTGPLLSVPFGMLLTGPADATNLRQAPWLLRGMSIAHVPAPANFVGLRRIAGQSRATRPWFGFGDFQPVTLAQARRSFPAATCANSAEALATLPRLPAFVTGLSLSRRIMSASPSDELLGPGYTAGAVQRADLKTYRVLAFASHGLLPTDLKCQAEPAIVTSAPQGAPDASGALLTASAVTRMDLDADAVILAACNSAGPDGTGAGESLSGLARAFFYAGARALMVTHWSVYEQSAAWLMVDTLRRLREGAPGGLAGALRAAQLATIDDAGKGFPAEWQNPLYWAPFALIGESGGGATAQARL